MSNPAAEDPLVRGKLLICITSICIRPGAEESLLTWSSKQIEGRPGAFWSVRRTFEKAGMGIREKGQEDTHIAD